MFGPGFDLDLGRNSHLIAADSTVMAEGLSGLLAVLLFVNLY